MTENAKQFVIQEHRTSEGVHWDFMLQANDVLWTWRLGTPPAEIGNVPIEAKHIFDHPLRFLTYEGPVQNGTGNVRISDRGTYTLIDHCGEHIEIQVEGMILSGRFQIHQKADTVGHLCRIEG